MTGHRAGHGRPVALVTGAARGIGRAAALALAGHGYDVVVNYSVSEAAAQQVAQEVLACGAGALVARADVADETAVRRMVATARDTYGRIDALVNNAGLTIDVPPSDLDGLAEADWDRVFAVNVRGMFCVTRACVPLLRAAPQAAIVNTASIAGLRPGPQPLPLRGVEGGRGEPDPDARRGARPGDPRQRGGARLDGR